MTNSEIVDFVENVKKNGGFSTIVQNFEVPVKLCVDVNDIKTLFFVKMFPAKVIYNCSSNLLYERIFDRNKFCEFVQDLMDFSNKFVYYKSLHRIYGEKDPKDVINFKKVGSLISIGKKECCVCFEQTALKTICNNKSNVSHNICWICFDTIQKKSKFANVISCPVCRCNMTIYEKCGCDVAEDDEDEDEDDEPYTQYDIQSVSDDASDTEEDIVNDANPGPSPMFYTTELI